MIPRRLNKITIQILTLICLVSCKESDLPVSETWLIPREEVRDGGPGKDGIPALLNPEMIDPNQATYLEDEDLVIGYKVGNDIRAYPHKILDWHEIINDEVDGIPIAITYCPLTGTGIGWDRNVGGRVTTFGVSGLLYNTNLIPYDRATDSNWTQIGLQSVNGQLLGTRVSTFPIIETTWETWKVMFPQSKVVSTNTGHSRNYNRYPYGSYRTEPGLIFSVSVDDNRLPQKERVHGVIINERVKVYQFDHFETNSVINDQFQNEDIIVVGSKSLDYIVSFKSKNLQGQRLQFTPVQDITSGIILSDQLGNRWNIFGYAVAGPNAGEQLQPTESFIGMWFSWAPFYENPEIYEP